MALELVRKFIDGAFRYVTEEEASGGGGSQTVLTVADLPKDHIVWGGAEPFEIITLSPGQILLDLWLTVTETYTSGGPDGAGEVFISDANVGLFGGSHTFAADLNIADGFAWDSGAPVGAAKSLAAQQAIDGVSKLVPLTAIAETPIVMYADSDYGAFTQGEGAYYALVLTP